MLYSLDTYAGPSHAHGGIRSVSDDRNRLFVWVSAFVLVASVIGVGYIALTPTETAEPYTEFYVLGSQENASNYPTNLSVGETGTITIGITNHEHRNMEYTVVLVLKNRTVTARTVTVDKGETWKREFRVTPTASGRKKLQIRLYKGRSVKSSENAYMTLRLWITVSGSDTKGATTQRTGVRAASEGSRRFVRDG